MNRNELSNEIDPETSDRPTCPECGHEEIRTVWESRPLAYGLGKDAVELSVRVPIRECLQCHFRYLDYEAEDLQHEAVCRHLGVLTPQEIIALREKYGLSRAEFARLTGLGEATIARWERGALIQNTGNDRYLRLLQHSENMLRLEKLAKRPATDAPDSVPSDATPVEPVKPRYGTAKEIDKTAFNLRCVA